MRSLVEGEHPVGDARPPDRDRRHTPEATMVLHGPLHHVLVGAVAEGRIGAHLTVAELVVASFAHVERHRTVPSDDPLALAVAEGTNLRVTTAAPVVDLALRKEDVRRIDTSERRHAWRAVAAFLVGAGLAQGNNFLLREVSHIIHANAFARSGRPQSLGSRREDVTLVSSHFAPGGTKESAGCYLLNVHVILDLVPVWLLGLVVFVRLEEVDFVIHFIIS